MRETNRWPLETSRAAAGRVVEDRAELKHATRPVTAGRHRPPPGPEETTVKRLFLLGMTVLVLSFAAAYSRNQNPSADGLLIQVEERNPWTHLRLNNDPAEFRFAIVSDRTGGHRARIFSQAVEQLNLLQPEFVLGVGVGGQAVAAGCVPEPL